MVSPWSCDTCTYRHEDKESSYLACAMCGSSRTPKNSSKFKATTGPSKIGKRKQGNLLEHFGAKKSNNNHTTCSLGNGKQVYPPKPAGRSTNNIKVLAHKRNKTSTTIITKNPPPLRSIFDALRPCRNSSFAPRARYRDDVKAPWCVIENDEDISRLCPMTIIRDVLPTKVASMLLEQLESESNTWNRGNWIIHGQTHQIPRTTATYNLTTDSIQNGPARYGDEPHYNNCNNTDNAIEDDDDEEYFDQRRTIAPELRQAANCIAELVRRHCPWTVMNENQNWEPTFAFANRYADGQDCVGWHADHLTPLGPRPIIVGLSLGACRRFDLRRQQQQPATAAASKMNNKDGTTTTTIDSKSQSSSVSPSSSSHFFRHVSVPLPHNSVCIMWNDAQETWQHSVPKCSNESMTRHPRVGTVRISLTFRKRRQLQGELGNCYCGKPAGLKAKNGKYFLFCRPYGKNKNGNKTCPFWKPCSWAEEEAKRLTQLQEEDREVKQKREEPTNCVIAS